MERENKYVKYAVLERVAQLRSTPLSLSVRGQMGRLEPTRTL